MPQQNYFHPSTRRSLSCMKTREKYQIKTKIKEQEQKIREIYQQRGLPTKKYSQNLEKITESPERISFQHQITSNKSKTNRTEKDKNIRPKTYCRGRPENEQIFREYISNPGEEMPLNRTKLRKAAKKINLCCFMTEGGKKSQSMADSLESTWERGEIFKGLNNINDNIEDIIPKGQAMGERFPKSKSFMSYNISPKNGQYGYGSKKHKIIVEPRVWEVMEKIHPYMLVKNEEHLQLPSLLGNNSNNLQMQSAHNVPRVTETTENKLSGREGEIQINKDYYIKNNYNYPYMVHNQRGAKVRKKILTPTLISKEFRGGIDRVSILEKYDKSVIINKKNKSLLDLLIQRNAIKHKKKIVQLPVHLRNPVYLDYLQRLNVQYKMENKQSIRLFEKLREANSTLREGKEIENGKGYISLNNEEKLGKYVNSINDILKNISVPSDIVTKVFKKPSAPNRSIL